jgi:RNA polymerase sporulation-specific sigma factor
MLQILSNLFDNFMFLILYISNGSSFPKPLSTAQEQYYLEKYQNGDQSAKDILIEHNLRLVAHVIKKYYALASDQDDLISIGTIGLIKGVTSFNASKGTKLATYVARCIENEIFMYFRSQKKIQNETFISDPIDTDDDGNSLTYMDIVCDDSDIIDSIDLKINTKKLYGYIEELTQREKAIITLRYGLYNTKPMTQKEVSKKLGISRSYVSRIEKKVVETLKLKFEQQSRGDGC